MKRVIVYVDGFNMFHSIKHRYGKQFYRLNYKKLASDFLEYEDKIVETKYFTALFPNDNDGVARHKQYIKALYSI
ncbi:MAG: hypothetical protein LBP53_00880 [Candidatus Peribacteria bacterium]|jgi:hypothetical protein|nr:hypothetical protein [Candidatus Peribacteria bacterium]